MKSQIKKKQKRKGGIVQLLIPMFFQKRLLRWVQKPFWAKELWGGCSKLED